MVGVDVRKLQWREIAAELKARHPGFELHHVFGRTGRLLACRAFIVPMARLEGAANHHDGQAERVGKMRDDRMDLLRQMAEANKQNMDPASCWFASCVHSGSCPLYRRACAKDAEEMAKCK